MKLTLDDILDARAYERERETLLASVIEAKRKRRVALGPIVSVLFESAETVRSQVQEMARVEHIVTDAGIEAELAIYNTLVPGGGLLCATAFIELTDDAALREWLPKLVGIERAFRLEVGEAPGGAPGKEPLVVEGFPEAAHAASLTRTEVTSTVHYLHFAASPKPAGAVEAGPVRLVVNHPAYRYESVLAAETRAELAADLRER